MRPSKMSSLLLYSVLFLFFFQLMADFIEAMYAFGLLSLRLPPEIASLLLLFSPALLLLLPRGLSGRSLALLGELMLVCRVVEPLLDTRARMLVAGVGVACFLLLLPVLLTQRDGVRRETRGLALGIGLTAGLSLSILFRALNSGSDLSTEGWTQATGWILAIIAGVLMVGLAQRRDALPAASPAGDAGATTGQDQLGFWRLAGLALGVISVLAVLYFSFASPNVVARWTGGNYLLILSSIVAVLSAFAILLVAAPRLLTALTPRVVLAWNILFVLSLVLTILAHQIRFPAEPGAYPLAESAVTPLHHLPLVLTLLLFPVILVDFVLYSQALADGRPSPRRLGGVFILASVFLLLMMLAHIFTTTYAYIPAVGPFFRDRFWLVYLITGITLTLPVLLVRRRSSNLGQAAGELQIGPLFPALIVLTGLLTVAGALLTAAEPAAPPGAPSTLKVLTYNIQQGYDPEGLRNFDGQLDLLREIDADIIGLQESDTNRIAGGNADVVRYFADRLDMHAYYGPKPVVGTFGIALLSRYPIEDPRTFYMYSYEQQGSELVDLEQTATIEAQITVADRAFHVFVTHLGNGGPMVQQEAVLGEAQGRENVILLGDFNFDPDSDQYRLTTGVLEDSWAIRWPDVDKRAVDHNGRSIDHIFVSPGIGVTDAQVLPNPASDHPAVTAVIEW